MHVLIDAPKCVTSGQCVMVAPEVFDQDDDGIVLLLDEHPPEHLRDAVHESASLCPAAAIFVTEV